MLPFRIEQKLLAIFGNGGAEMVANALAPPQLVADTESISKIAAQFNADRHSGKRDTRTMEERLTDTSWADGL